MAAGQCDLRHLSQPVPSAAQVACLPCDNGIADSAHLRMQAYQLARLMPQPPPSSCCGPCELEMSGLPSGHLHMAFESTAEQCSSAMCRRWMESWSATTKITPLWI